MPSDSDEQKAREIVGRIDADWSWHGTIDPRRDMDGAIDAIASALREARREERERLTEALLDAGAHIIGAASAYRKYCSRHRSVGRAVSDPFFTIRAADFDKAAERASRAIRSLEE